MISVLMPVFNGLPLLKASIESLKRQTNKSWECIVVDDGSTDGTSEYLDSLNDARFVIHHFEKNQGRPIARQKTLELAKGDFITMLDAEDLYASNTLDILLNKMQEYPEVSLVSSSMCSFGTTTDLVRKRGVRREMVVAFDGRHFPNHASSMMRTVRAKQFQYNPLMKLGQDRDFLEKYLKGTSFLEIPDILYFYSEFDSVSKRKIKRTYRLNIKKSFYSQNFGQFISFLFKYVAAVFIFPFLSKEQIIRNRGVELTPLEKERYVRECKTLVDNILLRK